MAWTVQEIAKSFANDTSIHGIGRVANAKYILHKLFWIAAFCASLGMLIYQVARLGQQYASHQVNTKITVFHGTQKFPAVTFCNLNPVLYSKVLMNKDLNQIIDAQFDDVGIDRSKFIFPVDEVPIYNYTKELDLGADNTAKKLFLSKLAVLDDEEFKEMSSNFEDFVIDCKFRGTECGKRNFTMTRSDEYGLCYELNTHDLMSDIAGPEYGLELVLNVVQKEYVPFMTESAGAKVIVHHPEYPAGFFDGFAIPTGFAVDIGVSASYVNRIEGPDKRCDPSDNYESVMSCIRMCIGELVTKKCGCAYNFDYTLEDEGMCETDEEWNCVRKNQQKLKPNDHCSNCKQPCHETTYHTKVSMTKWPSRNYEPIMKQHMRLSDSDILKVRDDFLLFRVFFSHLASQSIDEEVAYTEENFVSDIGGQLGLWCGLSVLSCVEVMEFVCFLIASCVLPRNKTKDKNKDEIDKSESLDANHDVRLQSIY